MRCVRALRVCARRASVLLPASQLPWGELEDAPGSLTLCLPSSRDGPAHGTGAAKFRGAKAGVFAVVLLLLLAAGCWCAGSDMPSLWW